MVPCADRLIADFDRALRTLSGVNHAHRRSPAEAAPEIPLAAHEREAAAALMRVNHAGEVCAQALYQGQSLTARSVRLQASLRQAATEEQDHLAWCEDRLKELGGRTSLLGPFWYAGSFCLGAAAGALGDRWNLGFLAETERQVETHLEGHLSRLPAGDRRTRLVVEQMRLDEAGHRETASALGAAELPVPVRSAMRFASRIMTTLAARV
jgi:ubiquinone biosynthesis monooxygenase Coq7